jgi:hypothetical protein
MVAPPFLRPSPLAHAVFSFRSPSLSVHPVHSAQPSYVRPPFPFRSRLRTRPDSFTASSSRVAREDGFWAERTCPTLFSLLSYNVNENDVSSLFCSDFSSLSCLACSHGVPIENAALPTLRKLLIVHVFTGICATSDQRACAVIADLSNSPTELDIFVTDVFLSGNPSLFALDAICTSLHV